MDLPSCRSATPLPTAPTVVEPYTPTLCEQLQLMISKEEVDACIKKKSILDENVKKAYSLILGQCTHLLQSKLEQQREWLLTILDQYPIFGNLSEPMIKLEVVSNSEPQTLPAYSEQGVDPMSDVFLEAPDPEALELSDDPQLANLQIEPPIEPPTMMPFAPEILPDPPIVDEGVANIMDEGVQVNAGLCNSSNTPANFFPYLFSFTGKRSKFKLTYVSQPESIFTVHKNDGTSNHFKMHSEGLHYFDTKARSSVYLSPVSAEVQTSSNQVLQNKLGESSLLHSKAIESFKLIPNFPISNADIDQAEKDNHPSLQDLSPTVSGEPISYLPVSTDDFDRVEKVSGSSLPISMRQLLIHPQSDCIQASDSILAELPCHSAPKSKVPFLVAVSGHTKFTIVEPIKSRALSLTPDVSHDLMWSNAYPTKGGVSPNVFPRSLILGVPLDVTKHCQLAFASNPQTHPELVPTNSPNTRSAGAICLGPFGIEPSNHAEVVSDVDPAIPAVPSADGNDPLPDDFLQPHELLHDPQLTNFQEVTAILPYVPQPFPDPPIMEEVLVNDTGLCCSTWARAHLSSFIPCFAGKSNKAVALLLVQLQSDHAFLSIVTMTQSSSKAGPHKLCDTSEPLHQMNLLSVKHRSALESHFSHCVANVKAHLLAGVNIDAPSQTPIVDVPYAFVQAMLPESSFKRIKHLNCCYLFISGSIIKGFKSIEYCPANDIIAIVLTKPLPGKLFVKFRNATMIHPD